MREEITFWPSRHLFYALKQEHLNILLAALWGETRDIFRHQEITWPY